jgi:1-acyl-sn-glycerol-3-phosphate acyltransferase
MIRANKHPVAERILTWCFMRMIRSHFHAIYACGAEAIRGLESGKATIGFANHTNWWDGVLLMFLTRFQPRRAFYCMMEEKQMRHYPFFSWLGAFSVDLESGVQSAATVRYALKLLNDSNTFMWIFPQGEMVNETDPIEIKPGADFLAHKRTGTRLLPVFFPLSFPEGAKAGNFHSLREVLPGP